MKFRLPNFWKRAPEKREGVYSDAIIRQIIERAQGTDEAQPETSGALEIAAGVIGRAFANAEITGAMINPAMLSSMARSMIVHGESVAVYNGIDIVEIAGWTIEGNVFPATWQYIVQLDSPSGRGAERRYGREQVAHSIYSYDVNAPWLGVSPLQRAINSGRLAANLERNIMQEAGGSVGYLLPIPTDGSDDTVESLKSDIRSLKGSTAVVETTAAGWGEGRQAAPRQDYVPQRIGLNPPPSVPQIHAAIQATVLAICGVPVELVQPEDGTGQREAWRRCLHGTIEPLARIIMSELSRVYGRPVEITFERLFASDIAGRARAFQSMVASGMSVQDAAIQSGLTAGE